MKKDEADAILEKWRSGHHEMGIARGHRWIKIPDRDRARALIDMGLIRAINSASTDCGVYEVSAEHI